MTMNSKLTQVEKPILVVGVAPLWELEYTGIANVVFELTKRFLSDTASDFRVQFSVFDKRVDTKIIESCLQNRSGINLKLAFQKNEGIEEIIIDENGLIDGRHSYFLFAPLNH